MGTISSGVGLISGLDYASLIDNLLALEARPIALLANRAAGIDAQKTAFLDISARISGLIANLTSLSSPTFFRNNAATSSNAAVLSATATSDATPGTYSFLVRSLASTQQVISRGFSSQSATLTPGTLTFESVRARVNGQTRLSELNGYAGVRNGSFTLTDGAGKEATISVGGVDTLSGLVDRINDAGLNVRAEVRDDAIRLTELAGGSLQVREVSGGSTAADLGFGPGLTSSSTGVLSGGSLIRLSASTPLSALNDGNGIRTARAGGDFTLNGVKVDLSELLTSDVRLERLNHGAGVELGRIRIKTESVDGLESQVEVDLSGAKSIGDVKAAIESAVPGVIVTPTSQRLVIGYSSNAATRTLTIEDVDGSTASDLGIAGTSSAGSVSGRDVLFMDTVGDLLAAVNYATGNDGSIRAVAEGTAIRLDADVDDIEIEALNGSQAIDDIGLAEGTAGNGVVGRRVLSGIDTTLLKTLNGGAGVQGGVLQIGLGAQTLTVDASSATTLRDVLDAINDAADAAGLAIEAGYDATGTRVTLTSLDGLTSLSVSDLSGTLAVDLGLAGNGVSLRGANVQKQYVNEGTLIEQLNDGRGLGLGTIRLTDSLGRGSSVNLNDGTVKTLNDVILKINAAGIGVTAEVNETGDGLLLRDTAGGTLGLSVSDESGTAARDLNIAGAFAEGVADGSYERKIEVGANTTLDDLVDLIAEANVNATATILNDGSGANPYRLQITSNTSGTAGELLIDGSAIGLDLSTLSRAQDAELILGSDPNSGIVIRSASNSFSGVVPGLTLTAGSVSDTVATVTVSRDDSSLTTTIDSLVSGFNDLLDRIDDVGGYDVETEQAGILLGDGTLLTTESRLLRAFTGSTSGLNGVLSRLSQIGVTLEEGRLSFDSTKLNDLLKSNPEAVADFFSTDETGFANAAKTALEAIASDGGLIEGRTDSLDAQRELLTERMDRLSSLLESKRERLTRQFLAMESTLAELQSQQASLGQLSSLLANASTSAVRR